MRPLHGRGHSPCHEHLVLRRATFVIDVVGVMQFFRPVDRNPHADALLCEKGRPVVLEQRAVPLKRVPEALMLGDDRLREGDHRGDGRESHERRFAASSGESLARPGMGNDAVKMYPSHLDTDNDRELRADEHGVTVLFARPSWCGQ